MSKLLRTAFCLCALVALYAAPARADAIGATIGPTTGCTDCYGAKYTLTYELLTQGDDLNWNTDHTVDTYRVTLTIDPTGYTGGATDRIDEVAVKISSTVDTGQLYSAPSGSTWLALKDNTGLNSNGCSGSGNGWECAQSSVSAAVFGAPLQWVFLVDIKEPVFSFTSTDPNSLPSIKVHYVTEYGKQVGMVSEKVPEPATLALLGVGLAVAAIRRRRTQS